MKRRFAFYRCACLVLLMGATIANAQNNEPTEAIEKTIQGYLAALSNRDLDSVRNLLGPGFAAIEASAKSARIHFVNTNDPKKLLPPEGNNDWKKENFKLTDVKAQVSPTHPSVATASFTLVFPWNEKKLENLKTALAQAPNEFDAERRKAAEKIIADKAIHNAMFAMLAREEGKWKIVCMSFPK